MKLFYLLTIWMFWSLNIIHVVRSIASYIEDAHLKDNLYYWKIHFLTLSGPYKYVSPTCNKTFISIYDDFNRHHQYFKKIGWFDCSWDSVFQMSKCQILLFGDLFYIQLPVLRENKLLHLLFYTQWIIVSWSETSFVGKPVSIRLCKMFTFMYWSLFGRNM